MVLDRPAQKPVPEQLEEVACNLCGGRDTELVLHKDGFDIVRCRNCGLGYVNPRLTAEAVAVQYDAGYYEGGAYEDYVAERKGYEKTFRYRLARVETLAGGRGRILDVGCAHGFFLTVASERGWDAYGIDVAGDAVQYAAETLGLNARAVTLAEAGFPDGYFNAVIMNDTFEHLADPMGELRQIYRVLKPGGVVMLVTQDTHGLAVRLLKERWAQWKPREHLYYYTRPVLTAMMQAAGFAGVFVKSEGLYCTVDFLTGKLAKLSPGAGKVAASVTRGLRMGQVPVFVLTGYEVVVCGYKPLPGARSQREAAARSSL